MSDIHGVCAAVLTPSAERGRPDAAKAIDYYTRLLDRGCQALNVLGTTGEAMSLSLAARLGFMEALAGSGLPLSRIMVGTGSAAVGDAVELTRFAVQAGFAGALLMPPFYYRPIGESAVLEWYEKVVEAAGARRPALYLYNFPKMSGYAFSIETVRRLLTLFPKTCAGLKDSSNDRAYEADLARSFPELAIFPGSESNLGFARANALAGCISGSVCLWPELARLVWEGADEAPLVGRRAGLEGLPFIAAVRYLTALREHDPSWEHGFTPLEELPAASKALLGNRAEDLSYGSNS